MPTDSQIPETGRSLSVAPGSALVLLASQVASRAHSGQHRRDGWTPYINHPAAVAEKLAGEQPEVVATAWLHDVLEDTAETPDTLRRAGLPNEVIEAVKILTKSGSGYESYLTCVKEHPIACKVKIADMLANLGDAPTEKQIVKYSRGLLFLLNVNGQTRPCDERTSK